MRETRISTRIKIWKPLMNPVNGRLESREVVLFSDDKEKLLKYYNNPKVEPYQEESVRGDWHKWHLNFSPTSKLRYFNPDEFTIYTYGFLSNSFIRFPKFD